MQITITGYDKSSVHETEPGAFEVWFCLSKEPSTRWLTAMLKHFEENGRQGEANRGFAFPKPIYKQPGSLMVLAREEFLGEIYYQILLPAVAEANSETTIASEENQSEERVMELLDSFAYGSEALQEAASKATNSGVAVAVGNSDEVISQMTAFDRMNSFSQ